MTAVTERLADAKAALAKGMKGKRLMYSDLTAGEQLCGPPPGTFPLRPGGCSLVTAGLYLLSCAQQAPRRGEGDMDTRRRHTHVRVPNA